MSEKRVHVLVRERGHVTVTLSMAIPKMIYLFYYHFCVFPFYLNILAQGLLVS